MKSFVEVWDDGDYYEDVDDAEFDSVSIAQNDIIGNSSSPWID